MTYSLKYTGVVALLLIISTTALFPDAIAAGRSSTALEKISDSSSEESCATDNTKQTKPVTGKRKATTTNKAQAKKSKSRDSTTYEATAATSALLAEQDNIVPEKKGKCKNKTRRTSSDTESPPQPKNKRILELLEEIVDVPIDHANNDYLKVRCFVPKHIQLAKFECPVCHDLLIGSKREVTYICNEPIHLICNYCASTLPTPDECPVCRKNKNSSEKDMKATQNHREDILSMVQCECPKQCNTTDLSLMTIIQHFNNCNGELTYCPQIGCEFSGTTVNDIKEHEKTCEYIIESCEYCQETLARKKLKSHKEHCLSRPRLIIPAVFIAYLKEEGFLIRDTQNQPINKALDKSQHHEDQRKRSVATKPSSAAACSATSEFKENKKVRTEKTLHLTLDFENPVPFTTSWYPSDHDPTATAAIFKLDQVSCNGSARDNNELSTLYLISNSRRLD